MLCEEAEYWGVEYKGIPPTRKQITWTETSIDRIADGKIVESWFNKDAVGRLQQIGALPTPEQATKSPLLSREKLSQLYYRLSFSLTGCAGVSMT